MSSARYSILASLAFLTLGLFLFWGPTKQESSKQKKAALWKKSWQRIEYYEEGAAKASLVFIRQEGLWRDRYYIESPLRPESAESKNKNKTGQEPKQSKYLRRRANHFVKNIFSDWYRPRLLGYYGIQGAQEQDKSTALKSKESSKKQNLKGVKKIEEEKRDETQSQLKQPKDRSFMSLKQAGIVDTSPRLLFYGDEKASAQEAFVLLLGKSAAARGILAHFNKEPALLLTLPKYLLSKFDKPAFYFRSKETLYFPSGAYIKNIKISLDEKKHLSIRQERKKEGQSTRKRWTFRESEMLEKEFKAALGNSLENALKQLKIDYFADAKETQKFPSSQSLWERTKKNFLELKIEIEKGKSYTFRMRKPQDKLIVKKTQLALLKSSEDDFVDFINMRKLDIFIEKLESIKKFLSDQEKKNAKSFKKFPEKKAIN